MKAIVEGLSIPLNIPQGFRITSEQFEQLAEAELARLELTEERCLRFIQLSSILASRSLFQFSFCFDTNIISLN